MTRYFDPTRRQVDVAAVAVVPPGERSTVPPARYFDASRPRVLPRPFMDKTDAAIAEWLEMQPQGFRDTIRGMCALSGEPIESLLRRRSTVPCSECRFNGYPSGAHEWNCPVGIIKDPPPRRPWYLRPRKQEEPVDQAGGDDDGVPF